MSSPGSILARLSERRTAAFGGHSGVAWPVRKRSEEADYKKFVEQTGFDYRTDLDAVAAGFRDGDEYFAVQGRFKWNRLADYAQSHQGKCGNGTCSMPASQAGKTISFSLLRRDVLALAVARDPQASRVIFPGFWKDPPTIPAAAIWVSAPPYVFADAKDVARGT